MVKEIIRKETFIRKLSKLDKSYIDRIKKLVIKIIQNPEIGKPMRYDRKGTRELYISPLRLSYKIEGDIVYILALYHKDEQ